MTSINISGALDIQPVILYQNGITTPITEIELDDKTLVLNSF